MRAPSLQQGQGFANIGDETLFWYSVWVIPSAGVRLARWERDPLGFFQPYVSGKPAPHVISAPIEIGDKPAAVSLNVAGLGEHASVAVTVLDEPFRELPGYSGGVCTQSGFRQRISWDGKDRVDAKGPIRLRIDFTGVRPEDSKFYAAYVEPAP